MQRRWYKQGSYLLDEIASTIPGNGEAAIWYLGQCGFVLKSAAATVYIDAVLNDLTNADGFTRRHYPPPFDPAEVRADYFLCTHGHRDHMALPTLAAVARNCPQTRFVVPAGCHAALEKAGVPTGRIVPVFPGRELVLSGLTVRPVSAAHPIHLPDGDPDAALCFSLCMDGVELLHLGDTYLTGQLLQDLQALPAPHMLFVPVNGSDHFRTARGCIGNLNALEAARLAVLLRADMSIPTHFDMVSGNTADPLLFVRELWQENSAAKWHIPALGERMLMPRLNGRKGLSLPL